MPGNNDQLLEWVEPAYKKLKQECYYDNINLFLRSRLARFETSPYFKDRLKALGKIVNQMQNSERWSIESYVKEISTRSFVKKIKKASKNNEEPPYFITNVRTAEKYEVESVDYFIDAPIELHILDVIWSIEVGDILDKQLDDYCLSNRLDLERTAEGEHPGESRKLFKIYFQQYEKWRDTAIERAQKALDNDTNVLIIGLDIKQCYYHLEADWKKIKNDEQVKRYPFKKALCKVIEEVHLRYYEKLKDYLSVTHPTAKDIKGLPIGLSSSGIIANWMLNRFDEEVKSKLQPLYYGRYVDDILIVLQSPLINSTEDPDLILKKFFIDNELLEEKEEDNEEDKKVKKQYSMHCISKMIIKPEKMVFQYYDANHSHAGLKEFSRELAEKASEFRFLPDDELRDLDEYSYDLIYKGSVNKLRSVVGLAENSTELSKFLTRHIMKHLHCRDSLEKKHVDQLFRFYKGRNIFDFCRLWEKVFTFFLINKEDKKSAGFYWECRSLIDKLNIDGDNNKIGSKLEVDMHYYLDSSLAMPLGLKSKKYSKQSGSRTFRKITDCNNDKINDEAFAFRESNMIRHHFVSYPLLNYTSYENDLDFFQFKGSPSVFDCDWDIKKKLEYSPRFIHHDEIQLFSILRCLVETKKNPGDYFEMAKELHQQIHFKEPPVTQEKDELKEELYNIKVKVSDNQEQEMSMVIGIANMKVIEKDIEYNYKPLKQQNLSFKRKANLFKLLNAAIRGKKCDLVVFPELSIPFTWVPVLAAFARKEQVGMVFGVEHVIFERNAHNLVFTVLPYKLGESYKNCFVSARLKNHYAPAEEDELNRYRLDAIKPKDSYYELFLWKGKVFSVFNCFELTNIFHRGLLQSRLDFLVAVSWNRDTSYYDHILTSTSRDLHCYIVYANTSQYGDSRVIAPKRVEEMDYMRVKGGIESVVMKIELDIKSLRDFQTKKYDPNDKRFKPLPAGFDESIKQRLMEKYAK